MISFFISEVETREPHRIFYQHHWCNNNYRQLLLLLCLTRNGHPDPFQPFLGFIQLWSFNPQKSKIHMDPCCQKLSFYTTTEIKQKKTLHKNSPKETNSSGQKFLPEFTDIAQEN